MRKTIAFFAAVGMFFLAACSHKEASSAQSAATEESINNSKTIIIYFSCSGNTESTAKLIAEATGGELYKIMPEMPYTDNDLDWRNKSSRASQEHGDVKSRPALAGALPDYRQYDTIYLGYPIWWGEAPRIMLTLLERSADNLKGKTIIPFCTSHSSPLGGSDIKLHAFAPEANWLSGKRFCLTPTQAEVAAWLSSQSK